MTDEIVKSESGLGWSPAQVYVMATICLALGLALGYLFRGSQTHPDTAYAPNQPKSTGQPAMQQQMPTLDEMTQMAAKRAEPLLAQLRTDPNNAGLLKQVAKIYESTHQFKEASDYYKKALDVNPTDVPTRTEMASCMYYNGDVDGALRQLQESLKYDPTDINALYNLGMIKWQGKKDTAGALAAWEKLLQEHPNFDRRSIVERSIARAKQQSRAQ